MSEIMMKNGFMMGPQIARGPDTVTDSVFAGESPNSEQWRKQGGIDAPLRIGDDDVSLMSDTDKILLLLGSFIGGFLLIKLLQVIMRVLKPW